MDETTPGAPSADAPAASSAAPTEAAPQSQHERMLASVEKLQAKAAASQAPADHAPKADGQPSDAENEAGKTDDATGEKAKQKPEAIPFEAFQARLGREKAKQERLQEAVNQTSLEVARRDAAIQLLTKELETLKQRAGQPPDESADQLRQYQLQEEARRAFEQVQAEHRAKLEQQQQQAALVEKRAALREQMTDAVEQFPGVAFETLRAEMLRSGNPDPHAVAAQIHERLRALFVPPAQRPVAPPLVRGSSATSTRPPNTTEGMEALVRSMMSKN